MIASCCTPIPAPPPAHPRTCRINVHSHRRAHAAIEAGRFKNEIVPCEGKSKAGEVVMLSADEGVRPGTTPAKLATLPPLQKGPGGVVTAGTSSQITDGASAVLVCNEQGLRKLGVKPRAKIVCQTVVGTDPVVMLYGPVPVGGVGGVAVRWQVRRWWW
jgi:acetyl-CoA acetyltransferase